MNALPGRPESLWIATASETGYPALDRDIAADVVVIGGGIAGLVTALLLQWEGLDVVLVERNRIGTGVTGHTTAKLSSLHQLTYARLTSRFGEEGARTYAQANEAGLARIAALVEDLALDCDFRRRPNFTYAADEGDLSDVEAEAEAARAASLPATFVREVPLPFPAAGAVRVDHQAEFHPVKFLVGLSGALERAGCRIFEGSPARKVQDGSPCRVETPGGRITAGHVVVATHFPSPDRAFFFARIHPERSYSIAARLDGPGVDGMFISASQPTRSIRSHPLAGDELLIVGGEGHKVGQGGPTGPRYHALERFAREHFPVAAVDYRWSTQDNVSLDQVPYIGRLTPRSRATYTATGFRKWGLAMAGAAAELIADAIVGRENPWQRFFDSNRLDPTAALPAAVSENANVGFHFFADRLTRRAADSLDELAPGEGKVVSRGGRQVAVSRDADGTVRALSARCTHLFCIVAWNDAERSWDCPCHGSRFATDGSVLHGPAARPLDPRDPPP